MIKSSWPLFLSYAHENKNKKKRTEEREEKNDGKKNQETQYSNGNYAGAVVLLCSSKRAYILYIYSVHAGKKYFYTFIHVYIYKCIILYIHPSVRAASHHSRPVYYVLRIIIIVREEFNFVRRK